MANKRRSWRAALLAFGWVALIPPAAAQEAAGPQGTEDGVATGEIANGQGLLWRIERDGIAPSYLFGTIHLADRRVVDLPAPVEEAFTSAGGAAFELVIDIPTVMRVQLAMALPPEENLREIVGDDLFARAEAIAARYDIPSWALNRLSPWAVAVTFSVPPTEYGPDGEPKPPLDLVLTERARAAGKDVVALETVEEQMGIFADLPEDSQVEMLRQTIDSYPELDALMERMKEHYLARDTGALWQMMETVTAEYDAEIRSVMIDLLLTDRNRRIAKRMQKRLGLGGQFIAVGALHLPGQDGVVALLRDAGFRVERVY